ncbi:type I signal peptidase, putative [Plasmodium gallinaceum]|uniref:Type I signal peptidase, putative n=1 Tax=Plasmodium gallinaceum TaxID=5849 RepID=A0A1J1GYF0_PLAGA|nr:type I signal peptidase, putative [Plasmodium gallinaceum]CRG97594.1 type I signal peptidase, putative [Plasmodium gallinaceum]
MIIYSHFIKSISFLKILQKKILYKNKVNYNTLGYNKANKRKYRLPNNNKIYMKNIKLNKNGLQSKNRVNLVRKYPSKKRNNNNFKINALNKKNFNINFTKIKYLLNFTKKITLCSLFIYAINNYFFDMTLTSGSSMHPLIDKNGVILFYICNDALKFFYKLHKIYIDSYIYILQKYNNIIKFMFRLNNIIYFNENISEKITNLKKKKEKSKHIYNRGDVVLLISPVNSNKRVCKRIIAIEKDKIYVDNFYSFIEIPKNNVWIEGDNKNDSFDSRNYGCVHVNLIVGKAFFLLDPFKSFSFINSKKNYQIESSRFLYLSE